MISMIGVNKPNRVRLLLLIGDTNFANEAAKAKQAIIDVINIDI